MGRSNKERAAKADFERLAYTIIDFREKMKIEKPNYRDSTLAADAGINPAVLSKMLNPRIEVIPSLDTIQALGNLLGVEKYKELLVYAGYGAHKYNDSLPLEMNRNLLEETYNKYPLHSMTDSICTTYINSPFTNILYCLAKKNAYRWYVTENTDNEVSSELTIEYDDPKCPINQWSFISVYSKRSNFDLSRQIFRLLKIREKNPSKILKASIVLEGYERQDLDKIEPFPELDFYFSIINVKDKKVTEYMIPTGDEYDYHTLIENELTI